MLVIWYLDFFRAVTASVFCSGTFRDLCCLPSISLQDSDFAGSPQSQGLDDYPPACRVFEARSGLPVPSPDQVGDLPHHRFAGLRWRVYGNCCHPFSKEMFLPLLGKNCFVPSYHAGSYWAGHWPFQDSNHWSMGKFTENHHVFQGV